MQRLRSGKRLRALALALVLALVLPATAAVAEDWEWTIAPYFWGSDVSLDVAANDEPVIGADVTLSDLLDKTDLAFMLHVEGRKGRAGFFTDLLYLSLGADRTTPPDPPLPGGTQISSELEMGLYEAAGFYRLLPENHVLDAFLGARLVDLDESSDLTIPAPISGSTTLGIEDSYLDVLAGLRYGFAFADRWDLVVRADLSTGGTELTWSALATLGVRLGQTDRYGLRFGWREMEIEVEKSGGGGVEVESQLGLSGPLAAFTMRF